MGTTKRRVNDRSAGTIFLVVGIVLFLVLETVAVILTVRAVQRSEWPHAEGTVVEVNTYVDRDSRSDRNRNRNRGRDRDRTMYTPVVEYIVDGKPYRFTSSVSTSKPWTKGDTVDVIYNPEDPYQGAISGGTTWVPWLLGGLGLVFGVVFGGVGWMIRSGRMGGRRSGVSSTTSGGTTYKDFSAPSEPRDERRDGPFGGRPGRLE